MAPKTEISEIRKEELTQAALKCTARKGYDRVTLDDVTKEAGLSKGIASYYFKNRDELLISIIHKMWRNLSAYSREIWNLPDQTDDPEEIYTYVREYYSNPRTDLVAMIKGGIRILISAYDDNPNIWRVIAEFWCQIPRNKMIIELNNSMQGFLMRTTAIIIQEGTRRGIFKKRNPEVAAYTLMSIILGFALNHFLNKGSLDSKRLEKELTDLILGYVCK